MLRVKVIRVVILSMIATIGLPFIAATQSYADTTITKTFTVTDSSGAPYAGALVQVFYWDVIDHYPTPTTTDAHGQAIITIPVGQRYVQWEVEPKAGDVTNAIVTGDQSGTGNGEDPNSSENVAVTLPLANIKVDEYLADGTTEASLNYGNVWYPIDNSGNETSSWFLRNGPVGLALPNNLSSSSSFKLRAGWNTDAADKNEFSNNYGLKATGNLGSETFAVYTDPTDNTVLQPDSSGVYHLQLQAGNIVGQLKNVNGNSLTIPNGTVANYSIYSLNSDGSQNQWQSGSSVAGNGTFYANLKNVSAGKYQVIFDLENSQTIPYFTTYIWVDSNGAFSNSASGTYSAGTTVTPFTWNVIVPTANFLFNFMAPDGITPDSGNVNISLPNGNGQPLFYVHTTGQGSAFLPDGTYRLQVYSDNQNYIGQNYTLTVASGVVTVADSNGHAVQASGGAYTFETLLPNLSIEGISSALSVVPNVSTSIFVRNSDGTQGNQVSGGNTGSGVSGSLLAPGSYILQLWSAPDYGIANFNVDVNTSGVAIIQGQTPSNGIYALPLTPSNFKFNMAGGPNEYYEICQGTSISTRTNCQSQGTGSSTIGGATLTAGTYYLVVHPASDSLANAWYSVNVATDLTVTVSGASQTNGIWNTPGATPNIQFAVQNPTTHSALTSSYIQIGVVDQTGNITGWYPMADVNTPTAGNAEAYLPDGNYIVQVNDGNSSDGLVTKSYDLVVTSGLATLTFNSQPVSLVGGRYVVSPATSNFSFEFMDPMTSAPMTSGWLDLCTDTGNGPNQPGSCSGYGVDQTGVGQLHVSTGNWYIRVNPGANSLATSKMYALTVDSSGNVTVVHDVAAATGTNLSTPSGSNPWILSGETPNITGQFLDSNGQPINITSNSNQGVNLTLQEMDQYGNWEYDGMGLWRQSASYGFNVTQANDITQTKHFRLLAQPQNLGDYADSVSSDFYLTSSGTFSQNADGSNASTALSDFNITLKTPNLNLEVLNPIDNSDLPGGWVTIFKVDPLGRTNDQWINNANIATDGTGLASAYLADGTYRLEVNAQVGSNVIAGLALNTYTAVVSNGVVTITQLSDNSATTVHASNTVLKAGIANVTGRLVASDGSALTFGQNQWVSINVQQKDASGNWQYLNNWFNPDQNGNFDISVNTPGTYRLMIQPNGYSNAATTFSAPFTLTTDNAATYTNHFGDFKLLAPDLVVQVLEGTSTTPVPNININVSQNNQWISNTYSGSNALATISFPSAGQYTLQLYPDSTAVQNGYTAKIYTANVAVNSDGSKTVTFVSDSGVGSGSNGAVTLALGTATIKGTVVLPNNGGTENNSQVIPYDSNGMELWQYSSSTTQNGTWAMNLPQGTYTLQAQPGYGDVTHGDSDRLGTVTVAADGTATLTGALTSQTTTNIVIPLKDPTWSGTIVTPDGSTPVPYAQVCLFLSNSNSCQQANSLGQWAMSAPTGFSTFGPNDQFQVQDVQGNQYPQLNVQNQDGALTTLLGSTGRNDITVHMLAPNFHITVTAGGNPAPNVNVSLIVTSNNTWLGNANTNASGVAAFNLPSEDLNVGLTAQINVNGNSNYSNYAYTVAPIDQATVTSGAATVPLASPNILGIVHAQSSGSTLGNTIPNGWVELDSVDSQGNSQWLGSTGSDNSGKFAFYAAPTSGSNFIVRIHANQGSAANGADSSYAATVNSSGVVTSMELSGTTTQTPTESADGLTYYDFSLLAPTITGVVEDASGAPVQNSWIQIFDVNNRSWLNSSSSDPNGAFGLALNSGSNPDIYQIQANPPGYVPGVAKSSMCQVTVTGTTVSSFSDNCNASGNGHAIVLKLHTPNLTFTLKSGSTPIANANVNIGVGSWNTWASSDSNGQVSLYIDAADIALLNPQLTGTQALNVWLNPSSGMSNQMVNSYCYSGQSGTACEGIPSITIGTAFNNGTPLTLDDVQVKQPNTHLQITKPDGTTPVGQGYWVTLESFVPETATATAPASAQNYSYLGGASTDQNGVAWFNVDTSTATSSTVYGVIVNPSSNDAQSYTTGYIGDYQQAGDWLHGLSWTELTSGTTALSPASPNANITVTAPDGIADRYGWINIMQTSSNGSRGWGSGLDYNGTGSALLPGNGTFQITAYPNGVKGVPTMCTVTTDASSPVVISASGAGCTSTSGGFSVQLSYGNVTGQVTDPTGNTGLFGAIVVAQIGIDTSTEVTTSTDSTGHFGFNLDASQTWTITVIAPVLTSYQNQSVPFSPITDANGSIPLGVIKLGN